MGGRPATPVPKMKLYVKLLLVLKTVQVKEKDYFVCTGYRAKVCHSQYIVLTEEHRHLKLRC